jgi:hypothetical protein
MYPESLCGFQSFCVTYFDKCFACGHIGRDLTVVAVCGNYQYNAVAFCGCARDGATSTDAFIIRVGMKANEC